MHPSHTKIAVPETGVLGQPQLTKQGKNIEYRHELLYQNIAVNFYIGKIIHD
jgi:hypothetical protein